MNIVRKDSYTRGTARRTNEGISGLHFLLMFVATVLLVLTRIEHPMVTSLQDAARKLSEPVLERISHSAEPVRNLRHNVMRFLSVVNEFRRLERELVSVRQLLDRTSKLVQRNEELGELVNLIRTVPVDAVTVEVIAGAQEHLVERFELAPAVAMPFDMVNRCLAAKACSAVLCRSPIRWRGCSCSTT